MSACTGVLVSHDKRRDTQDKHPVWEKIITFSIVSGDTTGAAAVPLNGVIQKIIVKLSDMASAEGTTDVSLTDNGDNTIWSVTDLPESVTYRYNVNEPIAHEVNVVLGFTNPAASVTATVTLRGI